MRRRLGLDFASYLIAAGLAATSVLACSEGPPETVRTTSQRVAAAWEAGEAYAVGNLVAFQGEVFRCLQAHTAQAGWTPLAVPALWERYIESQALPPASVGSVPRGATLEDLIFTFECNSNPARCCPEGSQPHALTDGPDVLQILTPAECILAGHGADTLSVSSAGPSALHLGPGDDTAMDGPGDDLIFGGDGRDTINGYGGTNHFFGGTGDDTIMAANGTNTVIPGPGRDTVALGTGDDTVYILNECEVVGGETISAGTGFDTLILPRPLAELPGLTVSGFESVIIRPLACYSECGAASAPAVLTPSPDACSGSSCCPSQEQQDEREMPHHCASSTGAADKVMSLGIAGFQEMLFGLDGDDRMIDTRQSMLVAGAGKDVVCAMNIDQGFADGGSGEDEIISRSEDALLVPGSGKDRVTVVGGSARIVLFAACEAVAGESYELVGGAAQVLSPLSRVELESRGIHIHPGIEVVEFSGNLCLSECAGAPTCSADEVCVSDGAVAFCEKKDDSLSEYSAAIHPGYPDLPDGLRQMVEEYVDLVEAGRHFATAPDELRRATPIIVPVLLEATKKSPPARRAAETFALGSLFTPPALAAVVEVALQPAPAATRGHYGGGEYHLASLHAARWLAVAAQKEPRIESHRDLLRRLILQGDGQTAEIATSAYLQIGSEQERRDELQTLLPADRAYLLDLEYR